MLSNDIYARFFEDLSKIVNELGLTYKEKASKLRSKMNDYDTKNLEEFISWFPQE